MTYKGAQWSEQGARRKAITLSGLKVLLDIDSRSSGDDERYTRGTGRDRRRKQRGKGVGMGRVEMGWKGRDRRTWEGEGKEK